MTPRARAEATFLKFALATAAAGAALFAAPVLQAPLCNAEPAADGLKATITAEGDTNVHLGGPPMRFNVTLVNDGADIAKVGLVGLVVSLGHCSCGAPGPA